MPIAGYLFRMSDAGPVLAPCPASGPCDLCEADDVRATILRVCSQGRPVNICHRCVPRVQRAMPAGEPIMGARTTPPGNGRVVGRIGPAPEELAPDAAAGLARELLADEASRTSAAPIPPEDPDEEDEESAEKREMLETADLERGEFNEVSDPTDDGIAQTEAELRDECDASAGRDEEGPSRE